MGFRGLCLCVLVEVKGGGGVFVDCFAWLGDGRWEVGVRRD